jgi:hypothetical protein
MNGENLLLVKAFPQNKRSIKGQKKCSLGLMSSKSKLRLTGHALLKLEMIEI